MKCVASAGLLLVALTTSAVGFQSTAEPTSRVAHSVVILDDDGTILPDMTLGVTRVGEPTSLQTYTTNECGSIEIPAQLSSGKYHFEIRCQGLLVGAVDLTVEPTFELGLLMAIRLERDGGTTIEYTGAWIDTQQPPNPPLTTAPPH